MFLEVDQKNKITDNNNNNNNNPNDSIAEDDQNTETSPGDLRRLTVTQTTLKNHQLILM